MGNLCICSNAHLPPEERERRREQARIDKKISEELNRAAKEYRGTHRLLLLGAPKSGKSTIIKQMRLRHQRCGFTEEEKRLKIRYIYGNVRESICAIVFAMETLSPRVSLAKKENEVCVEYLRSIWAKKDFNYPPEFWDHTKALWQDEGVKRAFTRSNEYQLLDCAQYFLDKVDDLRQATYMPDNEDVVRCEVMNSGIVETRFMVDKVNFHIFDVRGKRDERRKWIPCFNDVTAIIFVVDCSSYNMVCREDGETNRLRESLILFRSILNNRWLRTVSVILFLNKQDILREKIRRGLHPLKRYFEDYREYGQNPPQQSENWFGEDGEYHKARDFIKDKFMRLSRENEDDTRQRRRRCYPHFITAVDAENLADCISNNCKDIVNKMHTRQYELL